MLPHWDVTVTDIIVISLDMPSSYNSFIGLNTSLLDDTLLLLENSTFDSFFFYAVTNFLA